MLTRKQIVEIITLVHADGGYKIRPEKIDIWFEALEHLDFEIAMTAAKYARTVKFYGEPKLQDFIFCLDKCTKPKELDISADQAFNAIVDGIRKYSYHHDAELIASLPDVVAQAAKTFGIKEIRMSENISVCRGQFTRCFESIKAQHEKHHLEKLTLPPSLNKAIEDLRSKNREDILQLANHLAQTLPEVA